MVFIGLVGECLEAITFDRTRRALRRLAEICPSMALLLRNGQEVKVPVSELRAGERVLVRPGKRIPVDGVVIEGHSAVDQSALTKSAGRKRTRRRSVRRDSQSAWRFGRRGASHRRTHVPGTRVGDDRPGARRKIEPGADR
ncbi:MAG: hypothetical protein C4296_06860 [Gemmataceae bacterium]